MSVCVRGGRGSACVRGRGARGVFCVRERAVGSVCVCGVCVSERG